MRKLLFGHEISKEERMAECNKLASFIAEFFIEKV